MGLWHWRVFMRRGAQLGHGATDDAILARAEALAFAGDPARDKDIERAEQESFELTRTRAHQAVADALDRVTAATARIQGLQKRLATSLTLLGRSKAEISQTWQILQAIGSIRRPVR